MADLNSKTPTPAQADPAAGAGVNRAPWCGQIPYYDDGSFVDPTTSRVAMGVIDDNQTPSDVYSFGYAGSTSALKLFVGMFGVTVQSPVIDNVSRKRLGVVGDYL